MEDREGLSAQDLERYFESDLNIAPREVQGRYYKLLLEEQLNKAKKNNGKPPEQAPLKLRETILRIAGNTQNIEDARKALKMDKDWENASHDGRPPIGGALDD